MRRPPSDDHLMPLTDFPAYTRNVTCLPEYSQQSLIHSTCTYEGPTVRQAVPWTLGMYGDRLDEDPSRRDSLRGKRENDNENT